MNKQWQPRPLQQRTRRTLVFFVFCYFHCWAQNCTSSSSYHCLVLVWSQLLFTVLSYENRKIISVLIPFLINIKLLEFHLNYKLNKFDFTTIVARFLAQGLDSCPTIWNLFPASSSHNVIPSLFAVPIIRQIWTIVAWAFIFWIVVIWYLVFTCCEEEKSQYYKI